MAGDAFSVICLPASSLKDSSPIRKLKILVASVSISAPIVNTASVDLSLIIFFSPATNGLDRFLSMARAALMRTDSSGSWRPWTRQMAVRGDGIRSMASYAAWRMLASWGWVLIMSMMAGMAA